MCLEVEKKLVDFSDSVFSTFDNQKQTSHDVVVFWWRHARELGPDVTARVKNLQMQTMITVVRWQLYDIYKWYITPIAV